MFTFMSLQSPGQIFPVWINGDGQLNISPSHGTRNTPRNTNHPGGRRNAVTWVGEDGSLWLFGGQGTGGDGALTTFNDLWRYEPVSDSWVWMHGSNTGNHPGNFGSLGTAAVDNSPPAMESGVGWSDKAGNLWLYGGAVFTGNVSRHFNDLWKYDPVNNQWIWMRGNGSGAPDLGTYGSIGVPSESNSPGGRFRASAWTDKSGRCWLFGGVKFFGGEAANDLWSFDPVTIQWTNIKGDGFNFLSGVYGELHTASPDNIPGGRLGAANWVSADGKFWLYGGLGKAGYSQSRMLNDLWSYDPVSNQWTWEDGRNFIRDQDYIQAVYGSLGLAAPLNQPGSRQSPLTWTDRDGSLWMFGGSGAATTAGGHPADFWRYDISARQWTWMQGDSSNTFDLFADQGSVSCRNVLGSRTEAMLWQDDAGTPWIYGGLSFGQSSNTGFFGNGNLMWRLDEVITPVTVSISPALGTICKGERITLSLPPGQSFIWLKDGTPINGATTQTLVVTEPGAYTAYLTDANGCEIKSTNTARISEAPDCPPAICVSPIFTVPDTIVCKGSALPLYALPALSYEWSGDFLLDNPTIQNPVAVFERSATVFLSVKNLSSNLIINGNFESGNIDFETGYVYCNTGNCLFPLANNGYAIGNNATTFHNLFKGTDHTSGNGNFMIINGADPSRVVWKYTVPVKPNTEYAFGTWISTLISRSPAQIRFSINGIQLGDIHNAPSDHSQWRQFFTYWNSGNLTSATIEIVNVLNVANGNDFGLDDIFFGEVAVCAQSMLIKVVDKPDLIIKSTGTQGCKGVTLSVAAGFKSYKWHDGTTNNTAKVDVSGRYWVTVSDSCNQITSDTITVVIENSVHPDLPEKLMVCKGDSLTLTAPPGFASYEWLSQNSGLSNQSPEWVVLSDTTDIYILKVKTPDGCSGSDSIKIEHHQLPVITLGPDTVLCSGTMISLSAPDEFEDYLWNDGHREQSIMAIAGQNYRLSAKDRNGCVVNGSININIFPKSQSLLKKDSIICADQAKILDPGGEFSSYRWNTGSIERSITVNTPGIFSVEMLDRYGCITNDTVHILRSAISPSQFLPRDTSVCVNTDLRVEANQSFTKYLWSTGASANQLTISGAGLYWLEGTDIYGCTGRDTINIKEGLCSVLFRMPSAFSPNGDGINDFFKPVIGGQIKSFQLRIYNRWGQKVFESSEHRNGWDGRSNGKEIGNDMFVWWCRVEIEGSEPIIQKGTVHMIK